MKAYHKACLVVALWLSLMSLQMTIVVGYMGTPSVLAMAAGGSLLWGGLGGFNSKK